MSGSVIDKATALKNSITGAGINKIVCKASSHDVTGPKKKHVDTLISLTHDSMISMPDLADMLAERTRNSNWVVVMKALITAHNLMVLGNGRFLQCMASRPNAFYLDGYVDRSSNLAMDMSIYIRNYARYLKTVCHVYGQITLDVMKVKRGENGEFAKMDTAKLLKSTSLVSSLAEAHLDLSINSVDMRNGVINTCFLMMYKDLVRLYQTYNDAMISILEKFFEMKKPQAKEAVELYRKCSARLDNMSDFFKLAEDLGLDTRSHLDLKPVPHDLLPALEDHVKDMDKKKPSSASGAVIKLDLRSKQKEKETKQAPSSSVKSSKSDEGLPKASDDFVEEQRRRLAEFNKQAQKKGTLQKSTTIAEPKPSTPTPPKSVAAMKKQSQSLDDLLGVDLSTDSSSPSLRPGWAGFSDEPSNSTLSGYQEVDLFRAQPTAPVSNQPQQSYQPTFQASFTSPGQQSATSPSLSSFEVLQPQAVGRYASKPEQLGRKEKGSLGNDINQGLSSTVKGLSLDMGTGGTGPKKTQHQWKSMDNKKTGGPNWQPTNIQPVTVTPPAAPYAHPVVQPMVQPMVQPVGQPMVHPMVQQPMMQPMGQQPLVGAGWSAGTTGVYSPPQMPQMQYGGGMGVGMYQPVQPMAYTGGMGMQPAAVQQRPASQDPFGPIPGGQARF